jgi:hypothetical protein
MSLGLLEVSLGRYAEALTALQPMLDVFDDLPGAEIMTATFIPDAVEAMVALGRHTEAEPLIEVLEHDGRRLDRSWMLAVGARCRSMWLAARGDVVAAMRIAEHAMVVHARLPMPFERARTQLLLGQLQRRQRQKDASSNTFREALRAFDAMARRYGSTGLGPNSPGQRSRGAGTSSDSRRPSSGWPSWRHPA